ncbi:hypothetical protein [Caldicellulosiruptor morganii]|uniref:Regulatory protein RecX n=1 Tax=Caldicellulosiruptor morganii TaxID=1387555 RepID=A0ABY7BQB3_9FIRM|nr:hypothetical protein [Caldicellulosiruptor morganii]WAM34754.1 hypothetical protein OTK00_001002 [Caldicellulosiruptor morganii]
MKEDLQLNKRRFLHLKNILENYTRTQRHLEEYSELLPYEKIQQIIQKQRRREEQINNIQKAILKEHDKETEVRNLVKNYLYTEGYLQHYKEKLQKNVLNNILKCQYYRKIQLENLIKKADDEEEKDF